MPRYRGSCHCGNVEFSFEAEEITAAIRCDCSICIRKGSILSTFTVPPDAFSIKLSSENVLGAYRFGSMVVKHHFCTNCGSHTFVETYRNKGHFRVNLGCVDGVNALGLSDTIFEGSKI